MTRKKQDGYKKKSDLRDGKGKVVRKEGNYSQKERKNKMKGEEVTRGRQEYRKTIN